MSLTAASVSGTTGINLRRAGKHLVFALNKEEFGVHALRVREIMGVQEITQLPQAPKHVKGVINLRGKIIPVIDLRNRLGFPETEYTSRTCIVVLQMECLSESALAGIVVDGVSDVLNIAESDMEDVPALGQCTESACLLGVANIKGQVTLLLDVDKVLAGSEIYAHGFATA